MNKSNALLPFTLVLLTVFLFSCASMSPNAKLLVGNWKPVSSERYIDPSKEKAEQKITTPHTAAKVKSTQAPSDQKDNGKEWDKMVKAESRAPMVIKADKTLEKTYHQQTLNGTWKLKHGGDRIIMTETKSGQKMHADIVQISDSVIVVIERLPVGDVKVKYVKVQ
jgi:hypothetical protein